MTRQDIERDAPVNTTDYIEKTLEELICRHGVARVRADLSVLLPRARWDDWQRLVNITDQIQRRIDRTQQ